jgi:hypothetical protein
MSHTSFPRKGNKRKFTKTYSYMPAADQTNPPMKTETLHARAVDRVGVLLAKGSNVLFQDAENIFVNAPTAIMQIAAQNELNGILLGLGVPSLRVLKLPITNKDRQYILSVLKRLKNL